jgi:hypothetical protein
MHSEVERLDMIEQERASERSRGDGPGRVAGAESQSLVNYGTVSLTRKTERSRISSPWKKTTSKTAPREMKLSSRRSRE